MPLYVDAHFAIFNMSATAGFIIYIRSPLSARIRHRFLTRSIFS